MWTYLVTERDGLVRCAVVAVRRGGQPWRWYAGAWQMGTAREVWRGLEQIDPAPAHEQAREWVQAHARRCRHCAGIARTLPAGSYGERGHSCMGCEGAELRAEGCRP